MFFEKKPNEAQASGQNQAPSVAGAAINKFYVAGNYETAILNIANGLMKNSAIIIMSDGNAFPASHIGEAMIFMNTAIQEVCAGGVSMNKRNWLNGEIPSGVNPKIEIGADKIASYIVEALEKYPTQEFDKYLPTMREFKNGFNSPEMQSAIGIKTTSFTRS